MKTVSLKKSIQLRWSILGESSRPLETQRLDHTQQEQLAVRLGEHTSDSTLEGQRCGGDVGIQCQGSLGSWNKNKSWKEGRSFVQLFFFSIFILYWSAVDLQRK